MHTNAGRLRRLPAPARPPDASRGLTAYTDAQREAAYRRFQVIQPFLEDGIPLTRIAQEAQLPLRTLRRWVRRFRVEGLCGLLRKERADRGTDRRVPAELRQLVEGLALQKPRRTLTAIRREVARLASAQGWPVPSYSTVRRMVRQLDPALLTWAHAGAKVYREEFELIYRHEATTSNAVWQVDHSLLPIWVQDDRGGKAKPWLTIVLDDYSRAVPGYFLGLQSPSAEQTALTLHQAIWRKADARWPLCGIPGRLYTDHGSDFTSRYIEQVAAALKMELVFSQPGHPRGRGKIERFFRSVEQLLLPHLPGFVGEQEPASGSCLTLAALDEAFRTWLLEDYHHRVQPDLHAAPLARWETGGFLPHLPESLEQLDLLLLSVAKSRRVQQDGIHLRGYRYLDTTLAAYIGEDVTIRYDPRDLGEIRVFAHDRFLCRAICPELAGRQISLKEVMRARAAERQRVRKGIHTRIAVLNHYQTPVLPALPPPPDASAQIPASPRLKRYVNE